MVRIRRAWWGFVGGMVASGALAGAPSSGPADLVMTNGRILTVDAADHIAQALAVRDGRIVAVGDDHAIRAWIGAHTQVVDLKGRTATPGLIDAHAHISSGGLAQVRGIDLSHARSVAEVVRRVAERARTLPPGAWLLGSGWDEGKFAERRYVLARDLDGVSGDHPVWLDQTTGHYGTANTRALKLAGISAETPNPPAGTIDRGADGAPSGVLKEAARDRLLEQIPPPSDTERRDGILASLALMAREGMTGVKDPMIGEDDWRAYRSLAATGQLTAHICTLWAAGPTLEEADRLIARLRDLPGPRVGRADLAACGVKLFMDGSGGGRTAWMYDDWNLGSTGTDVGNRGYPLIDPDGYRRLVDRFTAAGIPIGTHAIGDRAIDWVVDAYESALGAHPAQGLRHSIIHANVPTDHALEVMARLQSTFDAGYPEAQGPFTWWIGDNYAGNFGPQRSLRLNPFASYLQRGIRWAGGSDYDVTPLPARFGLWASVARETLAARYGRTPFGKAESVDIHVALRSYTAWAARQLFIEDEAGSLEPGKSADIAVWDRNPYTVSTAALREMRCLLTLYRGRIVWTDPAMRRRSVSERGAFGIAR
jgi:predicted amidohydrolase YtcJ